MVGAFCLCIQSPAVFGQSGGQPGKVLSFGMGARSLGMGSAYYAVADDASAAFWNPSGLAMMERKELMLMDAQLFEGTRLNLFTYAHPTATGGTWSLSALQLKADGFEKVNATFDPVSGDATKIETAGEFSDIQQAFALAWGRQLTETLSFGVSLKQLTRQLDDSKDAFRTVDFGMGKEMGEMYKIAFGVQNAFSIRSGDTEDELPLNLRLGNSVRLLKKRLVFGFDLAKPQGYGMEWHFGSEYRVLRWLALRFGVMGSPALQETDFGFGFQSKSFGLDIAQGLHELGSTTRVSLSMRFGDSRQDRSEQEVKKLIEEGFKSFQEGNFLMAVQRFNRALEADPGNREVQSMLARLQMVVGFVPRSTGEEELNTYIRRGAVLYVNGQDLRSSVNSLRYAFNRDPKNEKLLKLLNHVEREAGVSELSRMPEGPEIFTFIDQKIYDARQAIYDSKYDLALRRAADVLDLEPQNLRALEIMGSAFFLMEEKDKARRVWKKVLELDPGNEIVANFLKQLD